MPLYKLSPEKFALSLTITAKRDKIIYMIVSKTSFRADLSGVLLLGQGQRSEQYDI